MENSIVPDWLACVPVISSPEIVRLTAEIEAGRLSQEEAAPQMMDAFTKAVAVEAMRELGENLMHAVCPRPDTPKELLDLNDVQRPAMQAIKARVDAGELSRDAAKPLLAIAFLAVINEERAMEGVFVN